MLASAQRDTNTRLAVRVRHGGSLLPVQGWAQIWAQFRSHQPRSFGWKQRTQTEAQSTRLPEDCVADRDYKQLGKKPVEVERITPASTAYSIITAASKRYAKTYRHSVAV